LSTAISLVLVLSACSPAPTPTPTPTAAPTATPTPLPTATLRPTATPTAAPTATLTPTPKPTIPLEGLQGVPYPEESLVRAGLEKLGLTSQGLGARNLIYEHRPNLNDPNKTPIVFARDPVTNEIVLATRMNQQTKELQWHVAGLQDLGNALGIDFGVVLDGKYEQFLGGEFNLGLVTSSWGTTVQPNSPDTFSFNHEDYHIKNAQKYGVNKFRLGLVMGHSDNPPKWLREGNYSKQEAIDFMKNYIRTVMTRYKGVIKEYIVVNEPYRQDDILLKLIGPEYVEIAFQTARETDPNAILILNETENHRSGTDSTNRTLNIIRQLKQKGLVDKVGVQMHIGFNEWSPVPTKEDVAQTFKSYGVPVVITEFDYNLSLVGGSQQERFNYQGQVYKDMITAALNPGVCQSIGFWGVGDKDSWYVFALNMPNSKPNMWDDDYQPKPAYFGVYQALLSFLDH